MGGPRLTAGNAAAALLWAAAVVQEGWAWLKLAQVLSAHERPDSHEALPFDHTIYMAAGLNQGHGQYIQLGACMTARLMWLSKTMKCGVRYEVNAQDAPHVMLFLSAQPATEDMRKEGPPNALVAAQKPSRDS